MLTLLKEEMPWAWWCTHKRGGAVQVKNSPIPETPLEGPILYHPSTVKVAKQPLHSSPGYGFSGPQLLELPSLMEKMAHCPRQKPTMHKSKIE